MVTMSIFSSKELVASGEKEWYFYCPWDKKYMNSAWPKKNWNFFCYVLLLIWFIYSNFLLKYLFGSRENVFSRGFSETQPNTLKYFPKFFCDVTKHLKSFSFLKTFSLENILHFEIILHWTKRSLNPTEKINKKINCFRRKFELKSTRFYNYFIFLVIMTLGYTFQMPKAEGGCRLVATLAVHYFLIWALILISMLINISIGPALLKY